MHEATRLGAGLEGSSDLPARRTNDRGHEAERGVLRFDQTEAPEYIGQHGGAVTEISAPVDRRISERATTYGALRTENLHLACRQDGRGG